MGVLRFLALASPLLLAAMVLPGALGEILFAVLATAFPWALIALGAARDGRLDRRLRWPLLVLLLWYEACVLAILALRGQGVDGPWISGLPLAAAIELHGLFVLPLLPVGLLYALTFEQHGVRPEELEALRARYPSTAGEP